jgi:hypothetical protein
MSKHDLYDDLAESHERVIAERDAAREIARVAIEKLKDAEVERDGAIEHVKEADWTIQRAFEQLSDALAEVERLLEAIRGWWSGRLSERELIAAAKSIKGPATKPEETAFGLNKDQFAEVYQALRPRATFDEFEQEWARFQRDKAAHLEATDGSVSDGPGNAGTSEV